MPKVLLFSLLFFIQNITDAQTYLGSIRGTVVDDLTSATIENVKVSIVVNEAMKVSYTNKEGIFFIDSIPVGRYELQIEKQGYELEIIKDINVNSSKEVLINIDIKKQLKEIKSAIVKSKTNKDKPLNTLATVSSRMLSVEEAKRYAGGFDDPARLASSFAGVASSIKNNGIVIRGNAPKFLQWKMEGVEIPNPNHFADLASFGAGGLTALSSNLLANSDFFSSAFPAEYSNAISGVFDIFMRNGNNKKRETTFQLGLVGIDFASEGPFSNKDKSSYLFNYRYSTLSLLEPLLPEGAAGTKYQDLSFKLNFPTSKAGTISIWGIGLKDFSGQTIKSDSTQWNYASDKESAEVKQYMGAGGITHRFYFKKDANIKTSLSINTNGLNLDAKFLNKTQLIEDKSNIDNKNSSIVFSSMLNKKFSDKHFNRTGFVFTNYRYDIFLANNNNNIMQTYVNEKGNSSLVSAFTQSNYTANQKINFNIGFNIQLFTLNNNYSIEPRLGIKYQLNSKQQIAFGYGKHSRLERIQFYLAKNSVTANMQPNKNLDFTKAHHFVLSHFYKLNANLSLKTELYYQYLYDVPVIQDSSFSFINMQADWFFNSPLNNNGLGQNVGMDVTLEKYFSKGYYYLLTASLFNSRYLGGNGLWYNTRFNKNYILNYLIGKEWKIGKQKNKTISTNIRFNYQGGDRYSPINNLLSVQNLAYVSDENRAYSLQFKPALVTHFTINYITNRKNSTQEISLKILNATQYKEFDSFKYNLKTQLFDEYREALFIPNLSWRIEF